MNIKRADSNRKVYCRYILGIVAAEKRIGNLQNKQKCSKYLRQNGVCMHFGWLGTRHEFELDFSQCAYKTLLSFGRFHISTLNFTLLATDTRKAYGIMKSNGFWLKKQKQVHGVKFLVAILCKAFCASWLNIVSFKTCNIVLYTLHTHRWVWLNKCSSKCFSARVMLEFVFHYV